MNELTGDNLWCAAHGYVTPDDNDQCPGCETWDDTDEYEDSDHAWDLWLDQANGIA